MKKLPLMLAIVLFGALFSQAANWQVLGAIEASQTGANRVYIVDYTDLTTSTTNTAQTLTVSLPANTAAVLTMAVLDTAFDTANTNYTGSLAVTVGDGSDADLFLASMELASDGTEVWKKYGQAASSLTLGKKVYTSADTLDFIFTPNTEEAVSANTSGAIKFYFLVQ